MASELKAKSFVLAPDNEYPYSITAKRYTSPVFDENGDDPKSFTLVLLHSTGFYKEVWEPTLEDLVDSTSEWRWSLIREAWVIECPNHGASAELNEEVMQLPEHRLSFTTQKYAQAAHRFLLAGPLKSDKVDFSQRNLIGIGHSLGACAMSTLQHLRPLIPFKSLILIEPMLSPGGRENLESLRFELVRSAYERRDVWPDREDALQALKSRGHTREWDPRTVQTFVKYGLREHPGIKYADTPYRGVTLSLTRDEEAAMYRDVEGATKPVEHLNEACSRLPVHVIFGAVPDYIPEKVHEALIDPSSPRRFASVSRIESAGHLIPQCAPGAVAVLIGKILIDERDRPPSAVPKL